MLFRFDHGLGYITEPGLERRTYTPIAKRNHYELIASFAK
jgi:hypothetical protein